MKCIVCHPPSYVVHWFVSASISAGDKSNRQSFLISCHFINVSASFSTKQKAKFTGMRLKAEIAWIWIDIQYYHYLRVDMNKRGKLISMASICFGSVIYSISF